MGSIAENVQRVLEDIDKSCSKAGIPAGSVELVAVSKTVDAAMVREAYDAGLRMFGENKVQEFVHKSDELPADIKWNIIGQLQTNKVKYIIDTKIYLLHSLDRESLAEKLQSHCESRGAFVDVLVQLNLSKEDTKAGVYADDVDAFIDMLQKKDRLRIKGIMTIGPNTDDESRVRSVFAQAKAIYDRLAGQIGGMKYLSMGMSQDYEAAILEGSNMVRIGTAVFGRRDYGKA